MLRALTRWTLASSALACAALIAGFFVFAAFATRPLPDLSVSADAIVVLTGGANRIRSAGDLLKAANGRRLLISGVNEITPPRDVRILAGLDRPLFACCVDIGYEARDTIGNAAEARAWVAKNGFTSLVVVTSRFHMPRSMAELGRALPGVTLRAYPIAPVQRPNVPWWQSRDTATVLLAEYVKFLPAAARFAASVAFGDRTPLTGPARTPPNRKPGTIAGAS
ncbi:MAG: YdcF family protein [Pseudomonadota bacterium]